MVLSANAVMRESEFDFYTQCQSKWTLLVEAAAAGITGGPGRLHRGLGNYVQCSQIQSFFPCLGWILGEYIIFLTLLVNLLLIGSLLKSYCSAFIEKWLSYS